MNDHQQPEPDDIDITPGAGTRRAPRRGSRSRVSTIVLVAAVVTALIAGPAVASRLAAPGTGPAGSSSDLGQVAWEAPLPVPTRTPDNANQREGRTVDPTPASTGENANQREGRTASGATCP